jgi:hypothetical protein
METRLKNHLQMFIAVLAACETNSNIITDVPVFNSAVRSFKAQIFYILETIRQQYAIINPDKMLFQDIYASSFTTLANTLENNTLFNMQGSNPNNGSHSFQELSDKNSKYTRLKENVASDNKAIDSCSLPLINNFDIINQINSVEILQLGLIKEKLQQFYNKAYAALKEMDGYLCAFEVLHPAFFKQYKEARKKSEKELLPIVSCKEGKIQGYVKDQQDIPVECASVQIMELNSFTQTNKLGYFVFNNIAFGNYIIKVRKAKFLASIQTVAVKFNKEIIKTIILKPQCPSATH